MKEKVVRPDARPEAPQVLLAFLKILGWGLLFGIVPTVLVLAACLIDEAVDHSPGLSGPFSGLFFILGMAAVSGFIAVVGLVVGAVYGTIRARETPQYGYILAVYGLALGAPSGFAVIVLLLTQTHEPLWLYAPLLLVSIGLLIGGVYRFKVLRK